MKLAEREGFEPPIDLRLCRISSAVHSTTLPPLREARSAMASPSRSDFLIEHDLFRKTGSHFSESCSTARHCVFRKSSRAGFARGVLGHHSRKGKRVFNAEPAGKSQAWPSPSR